MTARICGTNSLGAASSKVSIVRLPSLKPAMAMKSATPSAAMASPRSNPRRIAPNPMTTSTEETRSLAKCSASAASASLPSSFATRESCNERTRSTRIETPSTAKAGQPTLTSNSSRDPSTGGAPRSRRRSQGRRARPSRRAPRATHTCHGRSDARRRRACPPRAPRNRSGSSLRCRRRHGRPPTGATATPTRAPPQAWRASERRWPRWRPGPHLACVRRSPARRLKSCSSSCGEQPMTRSSSASGGEAPIRG